MVKRVCVKRSSFKGSICASPSKSHTLRAILFATLASSKSTIHNFLPSPDTDAMIKACTLLGARIQSFENSLIIHPNLRSAKNVIDAGNSGQVFRFIGAIGALFPTYSIVTGDDSIRTNRPVEPLLDGLTQLGAFAVSAQNDGSAPIIIKGPLKGGVATICGEDSQPVSGLLIAAAFAKNKSEIFVKNPGEKPWVNLTLHWFDRLKIAYQCENFEKYTVEGNANIEGFTYTVPGDFSSLAFPIVGALITNSYLEITGIDFDDCQGDKELIPVLKEMGAHIECDTKGKKLYVHPGPKLKGMRVNINNFIDAITILPVVACFASGTTEIYGASIARKKESDRIACIAQELRKMGAIIEEKEDGLVIQGSQLQGADVLSHKDHRMAMSLIIAALGAQGDSHILDVECINKSYPQFFDHLETLGAHIE